MENYVEAVVVLPEPTPPDWVYCSCVQYSKWKLDRMDESWGNAWAIQPNVEDPGVGDFLLTWEGSVGHIAEIIWEDETSYVLDEANYVPCQQTTRTLPKDSPVIRGGFRP